MQETRYFDSNNVENRLKEFFSGLDNNELLKKMNNRLFELEEEGHTLIQQKFLSLSEKRHMEKLIKKEKKLKLTKKRSCITNGT